MSASGRRWWQRPLRMMRVDPLNDYTWLLGLDMAEHARELRETYHCNCQWIMANGGSAPGTAPIVNFDSPRFEKNPTLAGRDHTGDGVFPPSAILRVGPVRVALRCPRPRRVWSTRAGELPVGYGGGRLELALDVREQYEIVAIEGAPS